MPGKTTILVVDDTPENIAVLDGILNSQYNVKAAPNGKVAIKIASSPNKPDLIFLDIMMPGIDGYEVLEELKANEETRSIPVIFVSAHGNESERKKGLAKGAVDFVTKPVDPDNVLELAQKYTNG